MRLPETRENKPIGKSKVLLSSGIALSFSAYLELFDIAQLYQKLSATEFFSELIRAIQDQERTIDEYIYRLDENCHPAVCLPPDLQELVHTMNAFTIYLTRMHEYDQAFEYWKSGYLLGQKIANNSLSHSAVVGNYLQRFGLNTLYLLHQHFDLPVSIQNKYADFLAKNPIQGQTRYQRILLNQYHATKNTLLKLYQAEDIIIANHKIEFPFLYLWNKEKSLKAALMITKAYFRYLLFEHKTNEEAYQQIYQNVI